MVMVFCKVALKQIQYNTNKFEIFTLFTAPSFSVSHKPKCIMGRKQLDLVFEGVVCQSILMR